MGAEMNLPHFHSGKVRETKLIPDYGHLLLPIATDRFSTHNVVHKTEIPGKGELLTALTVFWVIKLLDVLGIPHHVVAWGRKIYEYLPPGDYDPRLHYRTLVVLRLTMDLIEFVHRNYLAGSLEVAYNKGLDPYGLNLPPGLKKMHRFDAPLFTPTDKSETDEPLISSVVIKSSAHGYVATRYLHDGLTDFLRTRGIALIDGKSEASVSGIIGDEFGTGDCCRMTWLDQVKEGKDPPWLDKETGRQIAMQKWDGGPKVPLEFTKEEVQRILQGYHTAFVAITDMTLADFQKKHFE